MGENERELRLCVEALKPFATLYTAKGSGDYVSSHMIKDDDIRAAQAAIAAAESALSTEA